MTIPKESLDWDIVNLKSNIVQEDPLKFPVRFSEPGKIALQGKAWQQLRNIILLVHDMPSVAMSSQPRR